jgi:hypothetical protein
MAITRECEGTWCTDLAVSCRATPWVLATRPWLDAVMEAVNYSVYVRDLEASIAFYREVVG